MAKSKEIKEPKEPKKAKTPKVKKKKGPIRVEAIVPVAIVFLLFFAYFKFFFDANVKWAMEYGGTYANGAEVDVGSVHTSFLNASMAIHDIEVTDKEAPKTNLVQIGSIEFKALWDGLLRGKIVIPLASVGDIMVGTQRKHEGRVLPVKKSSESNVTTIQSSALAETQKALDGNIFGDIAQVAGGTDYKDKLKEMQGNLKSSQYLTKLQNDLKDKQKAWKERLAKLPQKQEFDDIQKRVKALKVDGKDPMAALKAVKEIDKIYKEVDAKVKLVKDTKNDLDSDLKQYKNAYADVNKFINEDLKDLEGKMGLPSLDPKDLAMRVFGRQFASQIQRAEKYMRLAREYMPPPKAQRKPKDDLTPREREKGRDYKFPITTSYPKFWLQRAHVNSKATEGGFSGTIAGDITNVTDDPKSLGKPMEAKLSGDFPHSDIHGMVIDAIVDHTGEVAKESGTIKVGAFPLQDVTLSDSKDVKYGFKQATGSSELKFTFQEDVLDLGFNANFDKIAYQVEAKDKKVQEILTNISNSLGVLSVNGTAKGPLNSLSLDLNSNIGDKLMAALKGEVNKQLAGLKDKLRSELEGKVADQKSKLTSQLGDFEKQSGLSLKNEDDAINSLKGKLDGEKKKAAGNSKDKLKDKGKDLLKKIKF